MTTTSYARVTFKQRTFVGRQSREGVGAKNGIRLVRVTGGGRDDLRVSGIAPETWEIPWTNIASAVAVVELGEPVGVELGEPSPDDTAGEEPAPSEPATPRAKAKGKRR